MARPVIALLTDFGTANHYAGTMKGVMLGICPDVTLVDIAHDLPAHDVVTGALELAATYRYFPAGTIFLVVVDPGVGTARRALAIEAHENWLEAIRYLNMAHLAEHKKEALRKLEQEAA